MVLKDEEFIYELESTNPISTKIALKKNPKEFLLKLVDIYGGENVILKTIKTETANGGRYELHCYTGRSKCWNM